MIYHGENKYPYKKDVFSCFADRAVAERDIAGPLLLVDLTQISEDILIHHGGADAVLKLLLKLSREKDFIRRIHHLMSTNPKTFVSLSLEQAGYMYEYTMFVGKGTFKNAKVMENAIHQIYGASKAEKIFTLADYYKQEAKKEEKLNIARQMLFKNTDKKFISEVTGLSLSEVKTLAPNQ